MLWKVFGAATEYEYLVVLADSFDDAMKIARAIDPRFAGAQVLYNKDLNDC